MGELTDEQAEAICIMIKNGYGKAFPMDENGHQIGWYDWLRSHVSSPETERLKALNAELVEALEEIKIIGDHHIRTMETCSVGIRMHEIAEVALAKQTAESAPS